mmetsp:Transcript_29611/g.74483  ORF Transcript_29611/g.74483 Transcript_29611/m.74483 type:complete len:434 (+) Transcript_29611:190-1491(+)
MNDTGPATFLAVAVGILLMPLLAVVSPELKDAFTADVMVGIDLGTTFSVVATCTKKNVTVQSIDGRETMPSVVYFNASSVPNWREAPVIPDKAVAVGLHAHALKAQHPRNVIYGAKRLIGLDYDDPVVQLERAALQYVVGKDEEGYAVPVVQGRMISPEEVGTFLLRRMKTVAQDAGSVLRRVFGFKFKSVTVSVPVSFSHDQKAATIRAANKAGFAFVRVIEEPIAAAIAYGLDDHEGDRKVVVFDFGGGTLDVALLRLDPEQGAFLVMDRAGDPHLGGEDFDTAIAQHFKARLQGLTGASEEAMAQVYPAILQASEAAKRALSEHEVVQLDTAGMRTEHPALEIPDLQLSRADLEAICADLLDRARAPLAQALRQMNLAASDIDDVVMVGGSSRLTAVRNLVSEFFGGIRLNTDINPDTAIAIGAARSFGC